MESSADLVGFTGNMTTRVGEGEHVNDGGAAADGQRELWGGSGDPLGELLLYCTTVTKGHGWSLLYG